MNEYITWDDIGLWSEEYGIDIDAMLEVLGEPDDEDLGWRWSRFTDANTNGLPDVLDELITDPTGTRPSQGGAYGGNG